MKKKFTSLFTTLKERWKLTIFVLLLLVGGAFFFFKQSAASEVEQTFITPEKGNITESIELSGTVDAKERARLRFIAGGKLTYLGAQEGDQVKKWQTLATIDQASLQKQLEQNLNLYMKERWDWEQTQDNIDGNYLGEDDASRRTIDKEQFDLNNTVLTVEIQDIAIKNTRLTAPFEGILVTSPASVTGVQLLATDYFEIVNPDSIIFRAYVDEEDVAKIQLNQMSNITLDAFDNEIIDSTVNYIAYTALQSSEGTVFIVEFPLEYSETSLPLRIGMNGDVQVVLNQKEDVMTIPIIATIQRDDRTYVQVKAENGTLEEREIEIGLESEDSVEIISGLTESDQVLLPE